MNSIGYNFLEFSKAGEVSVYVEVSKLAQENGMYGTFGEVEMKSCGKYSSNQQINKTIATDGTALSPTATADPCGYYPSLFPISSISISLLNGTSLPLNTSNLLTFDFPLYNTNMSNQWIDYTNPWFQSWM